MKGKVLVIILLAFLFDMRDLSAQSIIEEKLEKLSENIKQSDISLEDALKNFEEGIKLAKTLEKELDKMEGKIQILMNGEETKDGKVELGLFDETTEITGTRS